MKQDFVGRGETAGQELKRKGHSDLVFYRERREKKRMERE